MSELSFRDRELVALGAALAANCVPCVQHHIPQARDAGLTDAELGEVIDSLPEDYRVALVLRDLEGLSVAEVAEVSGCSLATAKIRIHRARKRLQESLGRECEFYKDPDDVLRCDRK